MLHYIFSSNSQNISCSVFLFVFFENNRYLWYYIKWPELSLNILHGPAAAWMDAFYYFAGRRDSDAADLPFFCCMWFHFHFFFYLLIWSFFFKYQSAVWLHWKLPSPPCPSEVCRSCTDPVDITSAVDTSQNKKEKKKKRIFFAFVAFEEEL